MPATGANGSSFARQNVPPFIEQRSEERLLVHHGSLYPALQRLEDRGRIKGSWGTSENNRRARFYSLTTAGKKQFVIESRRWSRLVDSMSRVLGPNFAEG